MEYAEAIKFYNFTRNALVSLLYIIDALHDSLDGDMIAVDEPELSLHPALQRRLADLLLEYSSTRQIVISTHSPYFVALSALPNGATVARVHVVGEESKISQLSAKTAASLFGLMRNENNPHVLGLVAQEIFFVDDRVILAEGQEDVVFFKKVEAATGSIAGTFFGWGVGGAENMGRFASVLSELGFTKVVGVLDGNRTELVKSLSSEFPAFHFFAIPADDIRTKVATAAKPPVNGLLDNANETVRAEHIDIMVKLVEEANLYLAG